MDTLEKLKELDKRLVYKWADVSSTVNGLLVALIEEYESKKVQDRVQHRVQEGTTCHNKHDKKYIHTSDEGTSYCEKCNIEEIEKIQHTYKNVWEKPTGGQPKYKLGDKFVSPADVNCILKVVRITNYTKWNKIEYELYSAGNGYITISEKELDKYKKIESVTDQPKTYTADDLKHAKLEAINIMTRILRSSLITDDLSKEAVINDIQEEILNLQKAYYETN